MYLRILIILSLLLSAFGLGVLALRGLAPDAPAPVVEVSVIPPPTRARVLVAARSLPVGTLLKDVDLVVRELMPEAVPPGTAYEEARPEIQGGLLRHYLEAGEAVPREAVLRPRDRGFLAAVLRPGYRAISVGVDVVTGAAGLIWPGDQVDLILTQELAANDAPLGRRVIGETVLADLRVLAVDQQFTRGAVGPEAMTGRVARTVTLEVTGEGAERIAVAGRLGSLSLTVRAIDPVQDARVDSMVTGRPTGGPIFGADVSPALGAGTTAQGLRMQVYQGGERQEVVFR